MSLDKKTLNKLKRDLIASKDSCNVDNHIFTTTAQVHARQSHEQVSAPVKTKQCGQLYDQAIKSHTHVIKPQAHVIKPQAHVIKPQAHASQKRNIEKCVNHGRYLSFTKFIISIHCKVS